MSNAPTLHAYLHTYASVLAPTSTTDPAALSPKTPSLRHIPSVENGWAIVRKADPRWSRTGALVHAGLLFPGLIEMADGRPVLLRAPYDGSAVAISDAISNAWSLGSHQGTATAYAVRFADATAIQGALIGEAIEDSARAICATAASEADNLAYGCMTRDQYAGVNRDATRVYRDLHALATIRYAERARADAYDADRRDRAKALVDAIRTEARKAIRATFPADLIRVMQRVEDPRISVVLDEATVHAAIGRHHARARSRNVEPHLGGLLRHSGTDRAAIVMRSAEMADAVRAALADQSRRVDESIGDYEKRLVAARESLARDEVITDDSAHALRVAGELTMDGIQVWAWQRVAHGNTGRGLDMRQYDDAHYLSFVADLPPGSAAARVDWAARVAALRDVRYREHETGTHDEVCRARECISGWASGTVSSWEIKSALDLLRVDVSEWVAQDVMPILGPVMADHAARADISPPTLASAMTAIHPQVADTWKAYREAHVRPAWEAIVLSDATFDALATDILPECLALISSRAYGLTSQNPGVVSRAVLARAVAEKIAQREREAKAAQAAAEREEREAAQLRAFDDGKPGHYGHLHVTRLRLLPSDPGTVETSRGATVPTSAARTLYAAWNGVSRPELVGRMIGVHRVNACHADRIIIGCHHLSWSECRRFGQSQGW